MTRIVRLAACCALLAASHGGAMEPRDDRGSWEFASTMGLSNVPLPEADRTLARYAADEGLWFGGLYGQVGPIEVTHGTLPLALLASIQAGYRTSRLVRVGAKIGGHMGGAFAEVTGTGAKGEQLDETWELTAVVIPMLVGGWIEGGNRDPVYYRGSLFVGPAFGKAVLGYGGALVLSSGAKRTRDALVPMRGATFAAEASGEVGFVISPALSCYLELGYIQARVSRLRVSRNVDTNGDRVPDFARGEVFADGQGRAIPLGFTGYLLNLGVRWTL